MLLHCVYLIVAQDPVRVHFDAESESAKIDMATTKLICMNLMYDEELD